MSVESIWGLVGMLDPSQLTSADISPDSDATSATDSPESSPQQQYPPIHAITAPTEVKLNIKVSTHLYMQSLLLLR